jgi:hypothetical protein
MTEPTLKIGTTGYKLNPEKLVGAPQNVLPYILGCFYWMLVRNIQKQMLELGFEEHQMNWRHYD